jgi:hypothetical protein
MHTPILPEKNAHLTGRAGTHYFWEFLMLQVVQRRSLDLIL